MVSSDLQGDFLWHLTSVLLCNQGGAGKCVTAASEHAACCDTSVVCRWVLPPTMLDQDGEWCIATHFLLVTEWFMLSWNCRGILLIWRQSNCWFCKFLDIYESLAAITKIKRHSSTVGTWNIMTWQEGSYPAVETWPSRGASERKSSCKVPVKCPQDLTGTPSGATWSVRLKTWIWLDKEETSVAPMLLLVRLRVVQCWPCRVGSGPAAAVWCTAHTPWPAGPMEGWTVVHSVRRQTHRLSVEKSKSYRNYL